MNFFEELKNLKEWDFRFFFMIFLGLIAPGILFLWRYFPHCLEVYTTPKLLLIAISPTIPINSLNVLLLEYVYLKKDGLPFAVAVLVACYFTVLVFSIPLLLSVFFPLRIRYFVGTVLVLELIVYLYLKLAKKMKLKE